MIAGWNKMSGDEHRTMSALMWRLLLVDSISQESFAVGAFFYFKCIPKFSPDDAIPLNEILI